MYDITRVFNPNEKRPPGPAMSGSEAMVDTDLANASAARAGRRALSAKLIRRLAAAADGFRDGREIYFMARFEAEDDGDFDLHGPFTRDQLETLRPPEGFGIFGPYQTADYTDDISRTPVKKITIELHGGETFSFEGTRFDALFWSVSALEKFAIPHYTNIRGVDKAQHILRQFVETDVFLLAHDPDTEETMIGLTPGPWGPQTIVPGDTNPGHAPGQRQSSTSLSPRSIFRQKAAKLVQRLSQEASDESVAAALRAPTDADGLAQLLSDAGALGLSSEATNPLTDAVVRGTAIKQELLRDAGGGWSDVQVAEALGRTRQEVDTLRRVGRLLGLQTGHGEYVYPACQFTNAGVLTGLDRFLAAFVAGGAWVRLSVLLAPAEEIGAISPLEALRRGDVDAAVLAAAVYGEQGGPAGHRKQGGPQTIAPC